MDYSKAMEDFAKKGGKITVVEEGKASIDPLIKNCQCGCKGNWTDHTMRKGERGDYSR